jgi:site-specific DNA recombinase
MERHAGLLVRLSTAKQTDEATDDATERQEERSRAFCMAKGWPVVRVYSDVDVSAYRAPYQKAPPRREGFEQALVDIQSGVIDALVCYRLDRLCRDHGDLERVLATCERHCAVVVSVSESIDTGSPGGDMAARLLVDLARLESQTIGLRVAAQREQTANRGLPAPGGWMPFGYRYVPRTDTETARYRIVEAEAHLIREAAGRVLAGETLNSIARDFNARGVVTPPPRRKPEKAAKAFYTRRLKRILINPAIAGLRAYHGEIVGNATWPPILDHATWAAARAILLAPERQAGGRPHRWPIAGLAVCGNPNCGETLRTKFTGRATVYACDPTKPGFRGCGRISINAHNLEQIVLKLIDKRGWCRLAGTLGELAVADTHDPGLAERLVADEAELRSIARQKVLGKLEEAEWLEMRRALMDRIDATKGQLERRAEMPREQLNGSKPIHEVWHGWTIEQKRAVLRALFKRIVILPATKRGRGEDPDRVQPEWLA